MGKKRWGLWGVMIFGLNLLHFPLPAQEEKNGKISVEERVSILEEELEEAKHGRSAKKFESVGGMGPSASGVYHVDQGLSLGGYGEVKYKNYQSDYLKDQMDLNRFILYAGYKFNDWIILNSEIEYEHAGFEKESVIKELDFVNQESESTNVNSSEVFMEFAYLDFLFNENFQVAAGLNLVPVGITNYYHEPTTFFSTERPYTETYLIPSTWREIGLLAHGELLDQAVSYRAGILSAGSAKEFSESGWIRDSRTKGSKAAAEDFAYVVSLDFKGVDGLLLGTSYYTGDHNQAGIENYDPLKVRFPEIDYVAAGISQDAVDIYDVVKGNKKATGSVRVNIAEAHYTYEYGPFSTRGLFARGWMNEDDARAVNKATGKNVGMVAEGGYIEIGYDILSFFKTGHRLVAFLRNEYLNTQRETVQRYYGSSDDLMDLVCQNSGGLCLDTASLSGGNEDLGIINGTADRELYGVNGVSNRANDRRIMTYGLAYFPHPNVVVKMEYEKHNSKADHFRDLEILNPRNNKADQINMAVGFTF